METTGLSLLQVIILFVEIAAVLGVIWLILRFVPAPTHDDDYPEDNLERMT